MIKFDFNIDDINKYQSGQLPENAIKLEPSLTVDEIMKKSIPFMIVISIFVSGIAFFKMVNGKITMHPIGLILGVMIGVILLFVHELLHAIVYPRCATVTVGKLKGKPIFVALASYPLKRVRFIMMSMLPFILGIVPLFLFMISVTDNGILNGILFGTAAMGMVAPSADIYNVMMVLKQTTKENDIMFYGDDIYKITNQ